MSGGVIDILVRPEAPYDRLMANAVAGELFGRRVWIASVEALLEEIAPAASGR